MQSFTLSINYSKLYIFLFFNRYVCISGAADQLQSNYAGDFRSILRTVFQMNVTPDEDESPSKEKTMEENDEEETISAPLHDEQSPPVLESEGESGIMVDGNATSMSEDQTDRDNGMQ